MPDLLDLQPFKFEALDSLEVLVKNKALLDNLQTTINQLIAALSALSISPGNYQGGHDASTGAYPAGPSESDLWLITVAGEISGTDYEVGQFIFYTSGSWITLNIILDQITVLNEDDFASASNSNPPSQDSVLKYFVGAKIKALYEGESNTNAYTDVEKAKLAGVASGAIANLSEDTTPELGGNLAGGDLQVSRVNLKDYGEITNAIGSIGGGTQDIDLELGNSVTATVDTSTTTFTFSNPTASDEKCGFTLKLTNGGSQTVNWPASVEWPGGTAPDLTAAGVDKLVFETEDGGTSWQGNVAGLDYS